MKNIVWCVKLNCARNIWASFFSLIYVGFTKGRTVGVCQQTRCERLHVCGWDLPEPPTNICQRPPVAHPGLLRPHRGGVRTAFTAAVVTFYFEKYHSRVVQTGCCCFDFSVTQPMSHLPPGCARVLSGWCHGCVWDDDLCDFVQEWALPAWRHEDSGEIRRWMVLSSPSFPVNPTQAERWQDLVFFCNNLFYKRHLIPNKRRRFQWDDEQQRQWKYWSVFSARCFFQLNTAMDLAVRGLLFQLRVSARRGLAVFAGLAVVVFDASCVYSPVFSWNLVPAAECRSHDGQWWLKHAWRRVTS